MLSQLLSFLLSTIDQICRYITIGIKKNYSWNLKYNRIDMKRRTSQNLLKLNKKILSSVKQQPMNSTASNSLEPPKKKLNRKDRQFGHNLTNLQKQPVFQKMQDEASKSFEKETSFKISQTQPYMPEICRYVQKLDEAFNNSILNKLCTKSSDSTEVTQEMRKILVNWILQVANKFKANQQTVHISIQIIDYILVFSHKKITKTNFQLLGISALFVASKYNQIYTPEAKKYVNVCDGLYTLEDLFGMESYILTLTNFNLQFPTVSNFLEQLVSEYSRDKEFKKIAEGFSKLIVLDFDLFNRYKKLHVCGAIIYLACQQLKLEKFSAQIIMRELCIEQQTFKNCYSALLFLHHKQVSQHQ